MSIDPATLRDEVLRLPRDARGRLVAELLRSLDADEEGLVEAEHEAAWGTEIAERLREIDAGEVQTVPWDEARRRMTRE